MSFADRFYEIIVPGQGVAICAIRCLWLRDPPPQTPAPTEASTPPNEDIQQPEPESSNDIAEPEAVVETEKPAMPRKPPQYDDYRGAVQQVRLPQDLSPSI